MTGLPTAPLPSTGGLGRAAPRDGQAPTAGRRLGPSARGASTPTGAAEGASMPTPPAQEQAASRKGFHLKQRREIDRCKTLTSPSVTMLETDGRWGQNRLPRWGHCGLPLPAAPPSGPQHRLDLTAAQNLSRIALAPVRGLIFANCHAFVQKRDSMGPLGRLLRGAQ